MKTLVVFMILGILCSLVFAGDSAWDRTVVNILMDADYTQEQIKEIMTLPPFPTYDQYGRLVGDQIEYFQNRRKAVVYSFDTMGCYTMTVLYGSGMKKR